MNAMWHFISDWRVFMWFMALSLIATGLILYFLPPGEVLTPVDEDDEDVTADQLVDTTDDTMPCTRPDGLAGREKLTGTWQAAFEGAIPPSSEPPPLPLWRQKQRNEESTTIVRWIDEEIKCAPDDASIVFKLYAEAAELHSVLVGETMLTPIEIYAQFLKAASDYEKRRGEVYTFSAEVIWGGETRGWLNFTL